jgi:Xaa-Pro aminopeptidase
MSSAHIAIDERGLGSTFLKELEQALPKAKFVPGDLLLRKIRSVKTDEELRLLVRAMEITEGAVQAFYSQTREGMTEEEAIRIFDAYVVSQGAGPKFSNIYFGHHSAIGHVARRDGTIRCGEVGRFDLGCIYQGYNSDLARSFSWGEPSPRALAYYRATLSAKTMP